MIALRTSTHAFKIEADKKYAKFDWRSKVEGWKNGFGRQVLGESWVSHHGAHKTEATRTHIEEANKDHALLNGVGSIFCETDVYGANPLQPSTILLRGEVTASFDKDSAGVDKKNNPMMPVAWTREFKNANGATNKILTTTMGAASDLVDENLRRLVVNGVYWATGLEVPAKADVDYKSVYKPTFYGVKKGKELMHQKEQFPADFLNVDINDDPMNHYIDRKAPKKAKK